jgi:hypothetical protein
VPEPEVTPVPVEEESWKDWAYRYRLEIGGGVLAVAGVLIWLYWISKGGGNPPPSDIPSGAPWPSSKNVPVPPVPNVSFDDWSKAKAAAAAAAEAAMNIKNNESKINVDIEQKGAAAGEVPKQNFNNNLNMNDMNELKPKMPNFIKEQDEYMGDIDIDAMIEIEMMKSQSIDNKLKLINKNFEEQGGEGEVFTSLQPSLKNDVDNDVNENVNNLDLENKSNITIDEVQVPAFNIDVNKYIEVEEPQLEVKEQEVFKELPSNIELKLPNVGALIGLGQAVNVITEVGEKRKESKIIGKELYLITAIADVKEVIKEWGKAKNISSLDLVKAHKVKEIKERNLDIALEKELNKINSRYSGKNLKRIESRRGFYAVKVINSWI